MTARASGLPPIPSRFGFGFSYDGRWATCLRAVRDDVALERWDLARRPEPSVETIDAGPVDRRCSAVPLDDGGVAIVRPADGKGELVLAPSPYEDPQDVRSWEASPVLAGYPLAGPGPEQKVLLVAMEDPERSRIWRLAESRTHLEPVLLVPGSLSGGVWLDGGRLLAFDHAAAGRRTDGIIVDLDARSWRRAWSVAETSDDRIAAYSPCSRHLAVTTTATGADRIGLRLAGTGPVRFPETLNASAHPRTPLTFDDSGSRLLIHEVRGAASRLLVYTPADDVLEPVPGPPGTLWPPASWTRERIHIRFSAPHQPPTLATIQPEPAAAPGPARPGARPGEGRKRWLVKAHAGDRDAGWRPAELVELAGPAGLIEAVVYGGDGWRRARRLVVALHGGPLSAWRFEFDPLLQRLAAAGAAVVAPNYRGSTGYGMAHLRPVIGDWGGPDLDDVMHLAREINVLRGDGLERPVLLGASYGAYLALLAAGFAPALWSRCAALAPFTSPSSLYREAGPVVRDRVGRLTGLDRAGGGAAGNGRNGEGRGGDGRAGDGRAGDGRGGAHRAERDVLGVCGNWDAPVLVVHGTRDEVVPVEQSRALRRRLLELGRTGGPGFDYLEVDEDHQNVVQAWPDVLRETVARFCLGTERVPEPRPQHERR
ncbi:MULTISPECIES: alpha/beta hydrolase family protein [Actinomadura]|uniref:Alpha/beta hydrolase family protein n=1 Tax=Actinomadura yumaensis TaxID=111807 RepID=A0ABW2CJJ8_9ACTN|nr:alpha/beta fold hydrolase [Actinomadura sp. J1-007]MWK37831.1 alpha/beta fold hydrolase [Actinomadura sp. J1-007]